jgi:hypothetical protein
MAIEAPRLSREDLYSFLGHQVGVKSDIPEVAEHLRSVYAHFYHGPSEGTVRATQGLGASAGLHVDIRNELASKNEITVDASGTIYHVKCRSLDRLETDMGRISDPMAYVQLLILVELSRYTNGRHLLHAGAVSWGNRGFMFPGHAGAGKTTLVLALVKRGFKFLSDEVASLHFDHGILEPFPRKLDVAEETLSLLGQTLGGRGFSDVVSPRGGISNLDVAEIIPAAISPACVPRYLVFLQGCGESVRLESVAGSNAVFKLLRFGFRRDDDFPSLLYKLAPIVDKMRCFNLVMGDMDETADCVSRLVDCS